LSSNLNALRRDLFVLRLGYTGSVIGWLFFCFFPFGLAVLTAALLVGHIMSRNLKIELTPTLLQGISGVFLAVLLVFSNESYALFWPWQDFVSRLLVVSFALLVLGLNGFYIIFHDFELKNKKTKIFFVAVLLAVAASLNHLMEENKKLILEFFSAHYYLSALIFGCFLCFCFSRLEKFGFFVGLRYVLVDYFYSNKERKMLLDAQIKSTITRADICRKLSELRTVRARKAYVQKLAESDVVPSGNWPAELTLNITSDPALTELAKLEERWLGLDR
jgi:hypothetical protein